MIYYNEFAIGYKAVKFYDKFFLGRGFLPAKINRA